MKLFVTGGEGFVGSAFCKLAQHHGHTIQTYGLERNQNICDSMRLAEAMEAFNPHWVVHAAAHASVRSGPEDTAINFEVNTRGTYNVLEAMRRCGAFRILFVSSAAVYGNPSVFPTPESAPLAEQTSLYGASKAAGEALVQAYESTYGFHGCITRLCAQLGPGCPRGHVVDLWRKLRNKPEYLSVMGSGRERKTYLHVQDTADALLHLLEGERQGAYNVSGLDWTVRQTIEVLSELYAPYTFTPTYSHESWIGDSEVVLDNTKILGTGWRPHLSVRKAIIDTVNSLEGWNRY